jgi:cell division protein FtsI (penicillin-binding protein 3)
LDIKKDILWRIYLSFIFIIVLGCIVIGRAFYIQQIQGSYWKNMKNNSHVKLEAINAERGSIYSEDGNLLSMSIPVFDIFIDFGAEGLRERNGKRFRDNLDSLSMSLASLFKDSSAAVYKNNLLEGYNDEDRHYCLKKKVSFDQFQKLKDFALIRQGRNKSGFIIESRDNRVNPYVLLANRTIGLSRGDTSKNVGLERTYDSLLKGQNGQRIVRYIAGAYVPVDDDNETAPEIGKDIYTTLDTYIQDIAENALLKMMKTNSSLHGTCIVMETETGKIKAIANLGKRPDGSYLEDYNYAVGKKTEPGSIFKLATLISLLEDKYVDTSTIVDCEGGTKYFYNLKISDSHLGTGKISVKEAFARSSNVAFAKLAEENYHDQPMKFFNHLHALRLDQVAGIDLEGQATPLIKKPGTKYWSKTTLPFMAHGYEELVTPLQMLMLYNAVANKGKMMKPYLVNAIKDKGVEVKSFKPEVLVDKICSDETLLKVKDCMLDVVESEHGTARELKTSQYLFAGKTGTAVTALDNKGYNKENKIYQSSFIGFFPFDNPRYTIAVVIQNGSESKLAYGGVVAAPVFREVADKLFAVNVGKQILVPEITNDSILHNYYGLNSDVRKVFSEMHLSFTDSSTGGNWRKVNTSNNQAVVKSDATTVKNIVPSVIGYGLKDAVYLLENMGFKVMIAGVGKVMYQSLAQGTAFNKGQTIQLQLN